MSLRQLRISRGMSPQRVAQRTTTSYRNVVLFERRELSRMQMRALRSYVEDGLNCQLYVCLRVGDEVLLLDDPDVLVPGENE